MISARQKLENAKWFIPLLNSYLHENDNLLRWLKKEDDESMTKSPSLQKLIDRVEDDIKNEIKEFYDTLSLISKLKEQKHRTIMHKRYIENKKITEIAEILGHENVRHLYGLFNEAHAEIEEMLQSRE